MRVKARGVAAYLRLDAKTAGCVVEDISAGGMFLRTDRVVPVGTTLSFDLVDPEQKKAVTLSATVMGIILKEAAERRGVPQGLRLRFNKQPGATQAYLQRLLGRLGAPQEDAPVFYAVTHPPPKPKVDLPPAGASGSLPQVRRAPPPAPRMAPPVLEGAPPVRYPPAGADAPEATRAAPPELDEPPRLRTRQEEDRGSVSTTAAVPAEGGKLRARPVEQSGLAARNRPEPASARPREAAAPAATPPPELAPGRGGQARTGAQARGAEPPRLRARVDDAERELGDDEAPVGTETALEPGGLFAPLGGLEEMGTIPELKRPVPAAAGSDSASSSGARRAATVAPVDTAGILHDVTAYRAALAAREADGDDDASVTGETEVSEMLTLRRKVALLEEALRGRDERISDLEAELLSLRYALEEAQGGGGLAAEPGGEVDAAEDEAWDAPEDDLAAYDDLEPAAPDEATPVPAPRPRPRR